MSRKRSTTERVSDAVAENVAQPLVDTSDPNWKNRIIIIGTLIGALLGFGSAYLLARTADESGSGPPHITTGDAIKTAITVIGVMRGIASLGERAR